MPPITARLPARDLLGGNLIVERARAGLSQSVLANTAGVTRQTISEIERAAANPTIDVLDKIVAALGIPIERLSSNTSWVLWTPTNSIDVVLRDATIASTPAPS